MTHLKLLPSRAVHAAFVGAVLLASMPSQAQDQALTGAEVRQALADKKVFARSPRGGLLDMQMRSDGGASVSVGNMNDTGTWRSTDGGYCAKWTKIRGGEESCFTVVRRGGSLVVLNADKSVSAEILRITD